MKSGDNFARDFTEALPLNHVICQYLSHKTKQDFKCTEGLSNEFFTTADLVHGCDAWIFKNGTPTHGVALRTQGAPYQHYRTFTIRYSRHTGSSTEFEKRIAQITNGDLYPKFTIQAYTSSQSSDRDKALFTYNGVHYLRIGVAKTEAIYTVVKDNFDHYYHRRKSAPGGNFFIVVPFADLSENDILIYEKSNK